MNYRISGQATLPMQPAPGPQSFLQNVDERPHLRGGPAVLWKYRVHRVEGVEIIRENPLQAPSLQVFIHQEGRQESQALIGNGGSTSHLAVVGPQPSVHLDGAA